MTTINEIIEFIEDLSGVDKVNENSDIFSDIGMVGDDFHEMIEKYAKRIGVDMTQYIWYFHSNEEGNSFGGIFYNPPYEQIERIPITPKILTEFANKGKWEIQYPAHNIPSERPDLNFNRWLFILFIVSILIWIIVRYILI